MIRKGKQSNSHRSATASFFFFFFFFLPSSSPPAPRGDEGGELSGERTLMAVDTGGTTTLDFLDALDGGAAMAMLGGAATAAAGTEPPSGSATPAAANTLARHGELGGSADFITMLITLGGLPERI